MRPPWIEPRTAYLHVPFCGHHCGYCDFAVTAGKDHLVGPYLAALEAELATLGSPRPVESLFVGGGTPTYLSAGQLDTLLTAVNRWLPLTGDSREFTVESTPESLDADKAAVMAAHGVSRVSVGVQSFRADRLAALDRRHGVEHIPRAVEAVRGAGIPGLSFDLIFASPGQTLAAWDEDLHAALAYAPDHVSAYGLTYERGTPLWKRRKRGELAVVSEDDELELYRHAIEVLAAGGFERYEVSNFARPGRRSVHNQRYWANEAYYGFGVGAARYVGGVRELNTRDTQGYIAKLAAGESPTFQSEELAPRERAFETLATQTRRADGVRRAAFAEQTGFDLDELAGNRIGGLLALGLLADTGDAVRLTDAGFYVADSVVSDLLRAQ